MDKLFFAGVFTCLMILNVQAQSVFDENFADSQPLEEYFAADKANYNKSIIYLFYNGQQCYECPQAIELAEEVYNDEFAGLYSLFVIDYTDEDGFNYAEAYDLYTPLAMVMVKISNGEMLGWHKINNLQDFADDEDYFTKYLTGQINDFLAHDDF